MEESTFKSRLLAFLKNSRISQVEFARALGVAPSYIGAMRKSVSSEKLRKIEMLYPQLNMRWLMYGEGEMLSGQADSQVASGCGDGYLVPMLPVSAFAGNLQMWSRGISRGECVPVRSPVKDGDFAIPICGDSMEPDFADGSTLIIKRINERAFIPWGSPMVIDTVNGVLFKDVYPDNSNADCIEARSRNPRYPVFHIPKDSILALYRVLCSLKLYPNL